MKMAAFDRNAGLVQAIGVSTQDCMRQLQAIGECSEEDFRFLPATDRLVDAVNDVGGNIRVRIIDGVADLPADQEVST